MENGKQIADFQLKLNLFTLKFCEFVIENGKSYLFYFKHLE